MDSGVDFGVDFGVDSGVDSEAVVLGAVSNAVSEVASGAGALGCLVQAKVRAIASSKGSHCVSVFRQRIISRIIWGPELYLPLGFEQGWGG